jgi:hypothetical protein
MILNNLMVVYRAEGPEALRRGVFPGPHPGGLRPSSLEDRRRERRAVRAGAVLDAPGESTV